MHGLEYRLLVVRAWRLVMETNMGMCKGNIWIRSYGMIDDT